jgi:pimeloyl-ACP methyl ester carboxylesterase
VTAEAATLVASERPLPEVPRVTHSMKQAGEIRLHVAEAGKGDPLVLLHGWPQHWYEWHSLIPALSERYHVICPDLRGFGWSDVPRRGYDRETMAADIGLVLDEMGIQRCRLIGHDWGGWLGFLLCLSAPERIERFVALNISPPFSEPSMAGLFGLWRFWYQWLLAAPLLGPMTVKRFAAGRASLFSRWIGASRAGWTDEEKAIFLAQLEEPERRRATVLLYRDFLFQDVRKMAVGHYRRMRSEVPTLLLWGVEDRIIRRAQFRGLERHADQITLVPASDTGHFIVNERPEWVLEQALGFLDGHR